MSWPYWESVIGLTTIVIMLIACIRLLSFDNTEEQQGSRHDADGSGDKTPAPSTINWRAA
jgi:hypothetical protein